MKAKPNNLWASKILLSACAIALTGVRVSRVRSASGEGNSGQANGELF
jgi:hypothetical protein